MVSSWWTGMDMPRRIHCTDQRKPPFPRSIFKHMTPKAFSAQWASNQRSQRTNTRKTDKSTGDDTEGTFSLVDKSTSSQYMELPDYGTGRSVYSQSGHSGHSWVLLPGIGECKPWKAPIWINFPCFDPVLYTSSCRVNEYVNYRPGGLIAPVIWYWMLHFFFDSHPLVSKREKNETIILEKDQITMYLDIGIKTSDQFTWSNRASS